MPDAREKKYRIRNRKGKTYLFSRWEQFSRLIEQGLIDLDGEVLAPGHKTWVPIRKVPKLATFFKKKKKATRSAKMPKRPLEKKRPKTAPTEAIGTRRRPVKRRREEDDLEPIGDLSRAPKPLVVRLVPALLSVIPGLGQAYNLHTRKAGCFALALLACVGLTIFNPGLGVPALIVLAALSMADAFGAAGEKGFLGGIWHGGLAGVRTYLGLVGIVLWALVVILTLDSIACWRSANDPVAREVSLSGAAPAMTGDPAVAPDAGMAPGTSGESDRENIASWVFAAIALGAGFLLFFLQGFGRKLVWARSHPPHFGHVVRTVFLAGVCAGLLAVIAQNVEPATAQAITGHTLNVPLGILTHVLSVTTTLGKALGKTWGDLVPGFVPKASNIVMSFGYCAADSFVAHRRFFQFVLLGSLVGFIPALYKSVSRRAKEIPPYADWLRLWITGVRERNRALRAEWAAWREHRAELWMHRQELLRAQHLQSMKTVRMTDSRLSRVEGMVEEMAVGMGVEVPPPATIQGIMDLDEMAEVGAMPMGFKERVVLAGRWFGRFITQVVVPKAGEGARRIRRSVASLTTKIAAKAKGDGVDESKSDGAPVEQRDGEEKAARDEDVAAREGEEVKEPGAGKDADQGPGVGARLGGAMKKVMLFVTGVVFPAIIAGLAWIGSRAKTAAAGIAEKAKKKDTDSAEEPEEAPAKEAPAGKTEAEAPAVEEPEVEEAEGEEPPAEEAPAPEEKEPPRELTDAEKAFVQKVRRECAREQWFSNCDSNESLDCLRCEKAREKGLLFTEEPEAEEPEAEEPEAEEPEAEEPEAEEPEAEEPEAEEPEAEEPEAEEPEAEEPEAGEAAEEEEEEEGAGGESEEDDEEEDIEDLDGEIEDIEELEELEDAEDEEA